MNLKIEPYKDQVDALPSSGQQIIGQFDQDEIVVYQAFNPSIAKDAVEMANSDVRLQWDPDHDPFGNKIERRAIQLGLKGTSLTEFSTQWISGIEDISEYVRAEKAKLEAGRIEELNVPVERVFDIGDMGIEQSIGIWK